MGLAIVVDAHATSKQPELKKQKKRILTRENPLLVCHCSTTILSQYGSQMQP